MKELTCLTTSDTPIGSVKVTAGKDGLVRIDLPGKQSKTLIPTEKQDTSAPAYAFARQAMTEILEYLSGIRKQFDILVDPSIFTPFQKRVLDVALQIPYGQVSTYGKIAQTLEKSNANRAVGAALGRNPIPIIFPCHRVVAANGYLTGFSAADGIRTKQWLLEMEGHKIVDQKLV